MTTTTERTGTPASAAPDTPSFWKGRSEFIVVAVLLALAVFLTHGTVTMTVPPTAGSPGPQFFPWIVTGLAYLLTAVLAWKVIRHPSGPPLPPGAEAPGDEAGTGTGAAATGAPDTEAAAHTGAPAPAQRPRTTTPQHRTHTDWRSVGIIVGTFGLFTVALEPVGWLLSAALLFFGVTYALDGKRPLFDMSLSLAFSAVIQLAFSAGLGLNLPAGILGGVL
ncbi:tripartite tricarboxylate transporter TctB family protein [Streptomyces sp. XC 2026]|uniref:tripartite tricarboxylate transporter TctB family protein n=1 Tax=Streptomyces sp. XC 2026 TaxID=2782004 RepID=UPI0019063891|nr:tripartite tricarboxylate transporter TctB family protein [Streptomyces sp. XC 2026]QQN77966.1 tripartite tricarboxylate transporter TctB family protein [Streptomyces sp. XC 2026]